MGPTALLLPNLTPLTYILWRTFGRPRRQPPPTWRHITHYPLPFGTRSIEPRVGLQTLKVGPRTRTMGSPVILTGLSGDPDALHVMRQPGDLALLMS